MAEIKIAVPYNHPIMVADRKREKRHSIAAYLVIGLMALAIGAVMSYLISPYLWIVFGLFAAIMFVLIIRKLIKGKPNARDNDRKYEFHFTEDSLQVRLDDTLLNGCAYNNFTTQYVATVIDRADRVQIQIVTGEVRSNNMQSRNIYMLYSIPKDVMSAAEIDSLKEFLQAKIGKRYRIK